MSGFGIFASAQSRAGIQGVWRVTEIISTGPNGWDNSSPQPGYYFFTKKHYSIIYVGADRPRPLLPDISKATADELRQVFVNSFVANAGTYRLLKGKLYISRVVAKDPIHMQPGQDTTSSVKIVGNRMTITVEQLGGVPVKNQTTVKLVRLE
jgi:hypothetical protein